MLGTSANGSAAYIRGGNRNRAISFCTNVADAVDFGLN